MVKHLTTIGAVLLCVMIVSTAPAADLLTEDWEDGTTVPLLGWITSGSGAFNPVINTHRNHTPGGQYAMSTNGISLGGNQDHITTVVSTLGETRVNVMFWYMMRWTNSLENDDSLRVYYSLNGSNFTQVWGFQNGYDDQWHEGFVTLPADAANKAQVWIRFSFDDSGGGEWYILDDIYVGDQVPALGNIWSEFFSEFGGTEVSNLTGDWRYPNNWVVAEFLRTGAYEMFGHGNEPSNFGARFRAFIIPPTTGDYTFWSVSDDSSVLLLSPDENPANAVQIADTTGWASANDWNNGNVHPSGPIPLVAGQRYYIESLMKEGGGGDNHSVGWQGPGITGDTERPIPASRFQAELPIQSVTRSVQDSYAVGTTFTVTINVTPGITTGALSLTETLGTPPAGVTVAVSNPQAAVGTASVVGPDSVQWDVADVGGQFLSMTYDVTITGTPCDWTAPINGFYVAGILSGSPVGPTSVRQIGDGWAASPIPWVGAVDVGPVATPGISDWFACTGYYKLLGSGADVWGNADQCQFLYLWAAGDFTISGDFEWIQTVNTWSKAGLMLRASLDPATPTVTTQISDNNSMDTDAQTFSVQTRLAPGGMSGSAQQTNWADCFLVMSRDVGATQTRIACLGDPNDDWLAWHGLRQTILSHMGNARQVTVPNSDPLAGNCAVGLFVVGHAGASLATAKISNVAYSATSVLGTDIGVSRDIWASSYLAAGSPTTVSLFMTAADTTTGTVVVTETLPAGWTASILAATAGTPVVGPANVITWTVDSDLAALRQLNYLATPTGAAYGDFTPIGLYDYGNVQAVLGRQIQVTGDQAIGQLPGAGDVWSAAPIPWDNAEDVGGVAAAGGSVWFAGDGRYEIAGSGADIWGGADEMQYLWVRIHDDFEIQADASWPTHEPYPPRNNDWAKAGIFVRADTSAGAPNYGVLIRWGGNSGPDRVTRPQWRNDPGGGSSGVYFTNGEPPKWGGALDAGPQWPVTIGVKRVGSVITGWADEAVTPNPPETHSITLPNIPRVCVLGFGVTSHLDGEVVVARFENVASTISTYTQTFTGPVRTVVPTVANLGATPVTVTIGITQYLAPGTSMSIVDNVTGVVTNPGGGTVAGGTITWVLTPWDGTTTQVTYTFIPYYPGSMTYNFSGYVEDYAGWNEAIPDDPVTLQSPVVGGSRAILSEGGPDTWVYGADRVNTVTLTIDSDDVTSIIVRDQVPAGWEIISVTGGTQPSPGVAQWVVTGVTTPGTTVEYTCRDITWDPSVNIPPPARFPGGEIEEFGGRLTPIPESYYLHYGVIALQDGAWPDNTFNGTDDCHIIDYQKDNNAGANDIIEEGDWDLDGQNDHKKILVQFTPPAGLPITGPGDILEAEVLLYYDYNRRTGGVDPTHSVRAQRILQPWIEGTGTGIDGVAAVAGEVSFNSSAHGTATWGIPGLMDSTLDSGPFGNPTTFGATQDIWVHLDVSDDVRAFVAGTRVFYGWKISQDQVRNIADDDATNIYNGQFVYNFPSSENADVHHRPMLLIKTIQFFPVEVSRFYLY